MKPLLIAFHGWPGAGKDCAANYLTETGLWSKVSFAAPLKRMLSVGLNIPMEDIENPKIKNEPNYKFGRSIRYMAQTIGTEWARNLISDSIWVDLAVESIEHAWSHGLNVVNTDLRFENEAIRIRELGGIVVHIIRDNNEHAAKQNETGAQNHASNIVLNENYIDFTIYNNGTVEMLHNEIADLINIINLNRGE